MVYVVVLLIPFHSVMFIFSILLHSLSVLGFPGDSVVKNLLANVGDDPLEKEMAREFLLGKSCEQRSPASQSMRPQKNQT